MSHLGKDVQRIIGMRIEILTTELVRMIEADNLTDLHKRSRGDVTLKIIMLLTRIADQNHHMEDTMIEIVAAHHLVIISIEITVAMIHTLIQDDTMMVIIIVIMITMTVAVCLRDMIDHPTIPDTTETFVNAADLMTLSGAIE
jgi:hypothetical protein